MLDESNTVAGFSWINSKLHRLIVVNLESVNVSLVVKLRDNQIRRLARDASISFVKPRFRRASSERKDFRVVLP